LTIAFYISGHGLGHATRSIELIRALTRTAPELRLIVRTSAPTWIFDAAGLPGVTFEAVETDVGVTQRDSITMDIADTARRAGEFYRDFAPRADEQARRLRAEHASLVLGDIPPLAHAAAERAGIPSIAIGNFTWDWIYEGYETFERDAPGVLPTIRKAYERADLALRLPMHGGFRCFLEVIDIPFIARKSGRDPRDTRAALNIPDDRPFVLASFGGYGVDLDLAEIAARARITVLSPRTTIPSPLVYQDLVAAADVVVSKPGYGIISECLANNTPLLYTSRGPFPEYDVFVEEMPRVLRCRFMPQEDLRAGIWRTHIDALLAQAAPPERAQINGAEVAAKKILEARG